MQCQYQGPIRLVLFDVDGVLTDGSLYLNEQGEQMKVFNVRDGLAIGLLRAHGIRSGVLSGKTSAPLDYRIAQLKFDVAVTGRLEKRAAYASIKQELGLDDAQIAYVGDDVVDFPLIGLVACFYAPADAHALIRQHADQVMQTRGGHGVAREVAEHILQGDGMSLEQVYHPLINQWSRHDAVQ